MIFLELFDCGSGGGMMGMPGIDQAQYYVGIDEVNHEDLPGGIRPDHELDLEVPRPASGMIPVDAFAADGMIGKGRKISPGFAHQAV